jgi:hypothetical protein
MPDWELQARMKALTGPNWETGFPLLEMARRVKVTATNLRKFRDGKMHEVDPKRRLGKVPKRRLADLLLKIECGMIECIITREKRSGSWWRTSICKRFIYRDAPIRPIRPVHQILMDNKGPSLAVGKIREKPVLPSFLGAFGKNGATALPTKFLSK